MKGKCSNLLDGSSAWLSSDGIHRHAKAMPVARTTAPIFRQTCKMSMEQERPFWNNMDTLKLSTSRKYLR